jgi:hypothetical protein
MNRREFLKFMGAMGAAAADVGIDFPGRELILPTEEKIIADVSPRIALPGDPDMMLEVHSFDISYNRVRKAGIPEERQAYVRLYAGGYASPHTAFKVEKWKDAGGKIPLFLHQWNCMVCGNLQPMSARSCRRCGANRRWVIR